MFKKSLCVGSITLVLLALLVLAGCSNPAASNGPAGPQGALEHYGAITAPLLKQLFADNPIVRLTDIGGINPVTTTVEGEVPPGKTLEIGGVVKLGDFLDVKGNLHVLETGELQNPGGALLLDQNARVQVDGLIFEDGQLFIEAVDGSPERIDTPRINFGSKGGVIVSSLGTAGWVDAWFALVNTVKWLSGTPFAVGNIGVLANWAGEKTLILGDTASAADPIDLSSPANKGYLVIADEFSLGAATLTAPTDGTEAKVIVAPQGKLILTDVASTLRNHIKVRGTLSTSVLTTSPYDPETQIPVPSTVDLTEATITAETTPSGEKVIKFDVTPFTINTIDVVEHLVLLEGRTLTVGSVIISDTVNKTLKLPANQDFIVTRIDPGANTLTINGGDTAHAARLMPDYIYGEVTFADTATPVELLRIVKDRVRLIGNAVLTLRDLTNLGRESTIADQLAQIAAFEGGTVTVPIGTTPFEISEPTTINTKLNFTTTGTAGVVISEPVTLNSDIDAVSFELARGVTLTVGPNTLFEVAPSLLILGPGKYTAMYDSYTFDATSGEIGAIATLGTIPVVELRLGDPLNPALVLSVSAATNGTFTPTVVTTSLYADLGAIVVDDGGVFTLGAAAEVAIKSWTETVGEIETPKSGIIALGSSAGLEVDVGSKISGFLGTVSSGAKAEAVGEVNKVYYGGGITVDVTTNGTFTAPTTGVPPTPGFITGASNGAVLTGTGTLGATGGIITARNLGT